MLSQFSVNEETKTLALNPEVANFTQKDMTDFSARLHRVLSSMHGEYSKIGQNALQRLALGRMAIMFRKFVVPGFQRRWKKRKKDDSLSGINNLLGEYSEGYYRTFGITMQNIYKDLLSFKFEAISAYGRQMTTGERANMIRFTGEMSFFVLAIIMTQIALRLKADDDDKDNILLNNFAYQAIRLRSELSFFFNPVSTMQILRSPMAAMSQLETLIKLVGQMAYPVTSGTFEFEIYQQGAWKDHAKIEKTLVNLLPVYPKQIYRIRDVGNMLSWFQ
jgi:hypothetical protein